MTGGTVLRRIFPQPAADVDVVEAYGRLPNAAAGRPAVRANMIASADGAGAVGRLTKPLGGPADRAVFLELRALADVILVGATTVRDERYGPAHVSAEDRPRRLSAGLSPVPPIAVVTRSLQLDWRSPFFTNAEQRPLVLTVRTADPGALARAAEVAEVIVAGETMVELTAALAALGDRGFTNVLTEGGPSLIGELLAAGLLDELCLTISPTLVSRDALRIAKGPGLDRPLDLDLIHVLIDEGFLLLRYASGHR
jgi:riboflavin biosynthesis pyrimidine reductase